MNLSHKNTQSQNAIGLKKKYDDAITYFILPKI